jgi:uncharacterized membrane protein YecN with MAPEG domain
MPGVNLNFGRGIHFLDMQQQPAPPKCMGLTLDYQSGALALLT